MKPFWHPLSSLHLKDLPTYAPPGLLRMFLSKAGQLELLYTGDRMWPSVTHGQTVRITPVPDGPLARGLAVIACPDGIPDLLRLVEVSGYEAQLASDAVPGEKFMVKREDILAIVDLTRKMTWPLTKVLRRMWIDLKEAATVRLDATLDQAESVRRKYDAQAPFYAHIVDRDIDPRLLKLISDHVAPGGRILVAGSGNGYDCFALARRGFKPVGIDFAPAIVEVARKEARQRHLDVEFQLTDLRTHVESMQSISAVLFTYDVYSFLPNASDRIRLLKKMLTWLIPEGVIFLSARMARRSWERIILTTQWLNGARSSNGAWGDSHTRWVSPDGILQRSFVHLFTESSLRKEVSQAGLIMDKWEESHTILRARG